MGFDVEPTGYEKTILSVRRDGDEREIVIRPTSSLDDELYEEWIVGQD